MYFYLSLLNGSIKKYLNKVVSFLLYNKYKKILILIKDYLNKMNICTQNIRMNISFSEPRNPRGERLHEDRTI